MTALVDLVPLRQFETWRDDGSTLRYTMGTIRGGSAGASVFVCELDDGGLRLILPCTHVTADVIAAYLARYYPAARRTESVFDGVRELIEVTMSHLMSIEHSPVFHPRPGARFPPDRGEHRPGTGFPARARRGAARCVPRRRAVRE